MTIEVVKAICQTNVILKRMDQKVVEKIPVKLRNFIKKKSILEMEQEMERKKYIEEQDILEETKAILFILYRYMKEEKKGKNV